MLRILPVLIATSVASLVAQTNWALVRGPEAPREEHEIGRASCRERV